MTNEFTASNGDTIETRRDGYLVVKDSHHTEWLSPCTVNTLREYFAAHPEPKPWHNVAPGEAWRIHIYDEVLLALVTPEGDFHIAPRTDWDEWDFDPKDPSITHAERIWPEETDDE